MSRSSVDTDRGVVVVKERCEPGLSDPDFIAVVVLCAGTDPVLGVGPSTGC